MAEDETLSTVVPDNRVITSPLGKEDNEALSDVFQGHWDAMKLDRTIDSDETSFLHGV
jgi:hypothetical protein